MRYFFYTFAFLLFSHIVGAQNFKIQLGAFADSVDMRYFSDRGVEGVSVIHSDGGLWRYVMGAYRTREEAESVQEQLKDRGFNYPVILDLEVERVLSAGNCGYTSSRAEPFQEEDGPNPVRKIFFEHGQSRLDAAGRTELDRFYALMRSNEKLELRVMGFTDNIGAAESNMELAASRAREARNYLITKGIKPDRMFLEVYGESEPLYDNKDENGKEIPENQRWNNRVMLMFK